MAETGAPQRAAPSENSLTEPHFARIGRLYRQKLLTTVAKLFDRENHSLLLDGRDTHSAYRLTNLHLVLCLRRDISQNRNRILTARIVRHSDQPQVVEEGPQIAGRKQRHEWITPPVPVVLEDFAVDQDLWRGI